ncbi:hypothetical protein [Acinetobacter sp. YH12243]|uniref:hypothetical protein n=1 Tax=Acinetobacter sp. YH12243 TaxID=2601169 RepID=UPI0015D422F8|nr:hypothetical protein [Acinetobacter sp. YH12243]
MNLIEKLGLEKCKQIVDGAPSNAESYQDGYYFRESPEFQFHNGIHGQWNLTDNNGEYFKKRGFNPVSIETIRAAIADHDRTDYVSDIRNHISPTTKVIEHE